jgi:hypothetical protein
MPHVLLHYLRLETDLSDSTTVLFRPSVHGVLRATGVQSVQFTGRRYALFEQLVEIVQ